MSLKIRKERINYISKKWGLKKAHPLIATHKINPDFFKEFKFNLKLYISKALKIDFAAGDKIEIDIDLFVPGAATRGGGFPPASNDNASKSFVTIQTTSGYSSYAAVAITRVKASSGLSIYHDTSSGQTNPVIAINLSVAISTGNVLFV